MSSETDAQRLIADLDELMTKAGNSYEEFAQSTIQMNGLWHALMCLETAKHFIELATAQTDDDICTTLKQLSKVLGEKAEPILRKILHAPGTPLKVMLVATQVLLQLKDESLKRVAGESLDKVERYVAEARQLAPRPSLANYGGYICIRMAGGEGEELTPDPGAVPLVEPGQPLMLEVWFQADTPQVLVGRTSDMIVISDGVDAPEVQFSVAPDGEALYFEPRSQVIAVRPGSRSDLLAFRFSAPPLPGPYVAWIQVNQQNRLIRAFKLALRVRNKASQNQLSGGVSRLWMKLAVRRA